MSTDAPIRVQFAGFDALLSHLEGMNSQIANLVHAHLLEVAQHILDDAQAVVPVDTGFLRDSGQINEAELAVEFTAPYALFIELGHHTVSGRWVPARPFLYPAFLQHTAHLEEELQSLFQELQAL